MANEYTMNFSDNTLKAPFLVQPQSIDVTNTTLVIYGKGAPNYGEGLQENLIRMLENFASDIPPANPTMGQLWFDSQDQVLNIWNGSEFTATNNIPVVAPAAPLQGSMYYDLNTDKFYIWRGAAWEQMVTLETEIQPIIDDVANHVSDLTTMHGATDSPTPSRLVIRDASGRAQVAAPTVGAEIARLDTVTAAIAAAAGGQAVINPTTPKDGDIQILAAPDRINIRAGGLWRQIFPAQYS